LAIINKNDFDNFFLVKISVKFLVCTKVSVFSLADALSEEFL